MAPVLSGGDFFEAAFWQMFSLFHIEGSFSIFKNATRGHKKGGGTVLSGPPCDHLTARLFRQNCSILENVTTAFSVRETRFGPKKRVAVQWYGYLKDHSLDCRISQNEVSYKQRDASTSS